MDLKLNFFGHPQMLYNGKPVEMRMKKAMAVLAYLATTGKAHSRERLATLFWPDSKDNVARTSLRQVTQALRQTPIASFLMTNRSSIGLKPEVESDVQQFARYMKHNDYAQNRLTLDGVVRLQSAENLYQGDFMQDFNIRGSAEWDDWQGFRRIEFQYQATCVVAALTRYYVEQQLADSGLKMAARWLEMDPYNDEAHYMTMHLYLMNQQAESAIEQYHFLSRLLEREHGREPDARITDLYEKIRQRQYEPLNAAPEKHRKARSLLPRPLAGVTVPNEYYAKLQRGILAKRDQPTFLIVIHDPDNQTAPALITTLAHDNAVQAIFPDGIFWGTLGSMHDFESILNLWLDAMRISILRSTNKIEHLTWQFHNGQRGKRMLFLLENVTDARYVEMLMPGYVGCTLIVTTGNQDVALKLVEQAGDFLYLGQTAK